MRKNSVRITSKNKKHTTTNFTACSLYVFVFYDKILIDNRVAGWALPKFSKRILAMLMKNYDFKDLMAFGMFILALLTFIFQYSK